MRWCYPQPGEFISSESEGELYLSRRVRVGHTIMFEASINYPREGEDGWKTIAIGGVLTMLSFLLLPLFPVLGYGARVLRAAAADPETASTPVFDDWEALFVDGLKQFAVEVVYLLLPGLVFGFMLGGVALAMLSGSGAVRAVSLVGLLGGFLVATVLFLLAYYLLPAALTFVALSGRLGDAFDLGRMRALVTTREYATRWLVGLAVLVVAGAVSSALSATGVGGLLAPFVTFYATVTAYYLYGGAVGVVEPTPEASEPRSAVRPVA